VILRGVECRNWRRWVAGLRSGDEDRSGQGGPGINSLRGLQCSVLFFISVGFVSAWMSKATDG
jgi:hypothetical protein